MFILIIYIMILISVHKIGLYFLFTDNIKERVGPTPYAMQ